MTPIPARLALKLVIGLSCAVLLGLLIHDRNHWKAKTAHYAEQLAGERAAHAATADNYRVAAEQARRLDQANAARVKTEQAAINERARNDFESRIAAARAADERMRAKPAAEADPGGRRAAPVPGLSAGSRGASQAAGQGRLSRSDALIATEQAIQLDELIRWVRAQADVETSKD